LLAIPLIVLAIRDVHVATMIRQHARVRPQIPFLTRVSAMADAILFAAILFALIGVSTVFVNVVGVRVLPPPWGLVLLYAGMVIASLALHRMGRWIERGAP
jgi:hypothetical protein